MLGWGVLGFFSYFFLLGENRGGKYRSLNQDWKLWDLGLRVLAFRPF